MSLRPLFVLSTSIVLVAAASGCDRLDMYDQPRYKPLAASQFFPDGLSARPQIEGTIARGQLHADTVLYTGKQDDKLVRQIPPAVLQATYDRNRQRFRQDLAETPPAELRQALLERGHGRYDIYCSVCHGRVGDGNGMIVERGFRKPPSYHIDRLLKAPDGHFFDVITQGLGAMPSYASRIDAIDRWAIVSYVRALQFSQNARIDDVPEPQRDKLKTATGASAAASPGPAKSAEIRTEGPSGKEAPR